MIKKDIKKGDTIKVLTGNSKGKIAKVLIVFPKDDKVLVEGVNVVSKHQKPTSGNPNGSIAKKEMPVHISNVQLVDSSGQSSRVGRREGKDGKTERYSIKTGNSI